MFIRDLWRCEYSHLFMVLSLSMAVPAIHAQETVSRRYPTDCTCRISPDTCNHADTYAYYDNLCQAALLCEPWRP